MNYVVSQDKVGDPERPLPAEGQGFLDITNPKIALVTWKKAQDGNGGILRLQELSGKHSDAVLHFSHLNIEAAEQCSGVEDDLRKLPANDQDIQLSFKPFEVVTVRVVSK